MNNVEFITTKTIRVINLYNNSLCLSNDDDKLHIHE